MIESPIATYRDQRAVARGGIRVVPRRPAFVGDRIAVMTEQLVAEARPGAVRDRLARGTRERAAFGGVAGEVEHPFAQVGEVAGPVQPPGAAVLHEVERSAAAGRDDRDAARQRLLHGLAERLVLAGVHEHVEAGVRLREFVAAWNPRKVASGSSFSSAGAARAVADDHEPGAGQIGERAQVLDLLLGGEATDVADDRLAVRRVAPAPRRAAALPGRKRSPSTPRAQSSSRSTPESRARASRTTRGRGSASRACGCARRAASSAGAASGMP